jgi:tetraacyldisaccharide-1-P 4'-kinase
VRRLAATERLTETLKQAGYDNVSCLLPDYKDWNAQLAESFREQPEEELAMTM